MAIAVAGVVSKKDGRNHILVHFASEAYNPRFKIKTVIAHYDRVAGSPGANDNSAADWQLMNWAVELEKATSFHNIRIFFTDGEELMEWVESQHPEITNPKNSEESALKRIGSDVVYEKMFKNYTKKQWDKYPSELDASVMERIPVRYDHNDRYFGDKYEGIPKHGYTVLVRNMLDHENIQVILGRDYHDMTLEEPKLLFYTGKIDTYFDEKFGKLEYRSIEFEHETLKEESFQDLPVINYPGEEFPYTRIIEHKKFFDQDLPVTTITKEYSIEGGEPYYPVPNQENRDLYEKYRQEAEKLEEKGIYFIGRLASYKYFNMNQAVRAALDLFERLSNS